MALALVLRILDEFPRHRSQRTDAWYLQKDRRCQCRNDSSEEPSLEHRRLRFSFQINDFKDPGTDLSVPPFIARLRRRRRFSRLGDPCQAVLFAKNLFSPTDPGNSRNRRRRRSTDPPTPRQAVLFTKEPLSEDPARRPEEAAIYRPPIPSSTGFSKPPQNPGDKPRNPQKTAPEPSTRQAQDKQTTAIPSKRGRWRRPLKTARANSPISCGRVGVSTASRPSGQPVSERGGSIGRPLGRLKRNLTERGNSSRASRLAHLPPPSLSSPHDRRRPPLPACPIA